MVDESTGPIEGYRLVVGLEHLDEDQVMEQTGVLDESAAKALSLMVGMSEEPADQSSMIAMKATTSPLSFTTHVSAIGSSCSRTSRSIARQ